jgi:hypothetical protein
MRQTDRQTGGERRDEKKEPTSIEKYNPIELLTMR